LARGVDDPLAVAAARVVLARAREEIRAGAEPGDLEARVQEELGAARTARLRRALNASGVIVHTNLGRAPLAEAALERVREVGRGYSNPEYALSAGTRGSPPERLAGVRAPRRARLLEVGTTNRTRAADSVRAIGGEPAVLLRVHQSNVRLVGFTELPSVGELAQLAQRHALPLADELGSGALAQIE